MKQYGIDVSEYQGLINWKKVSQQKDFAMIRAGFGVTASQIDPRFDENIGNAIDTGMHIGVYWFLYALNDDEAAKNATAFMSVLEPYKEKIDFPVVLDVEGDSIRYMRGQGVEPSKHNVSSMIRTFCDILEQHEWYVCVYSDNNFINTYFEKDILEKYDLWFAYWVNIFDPSYCTRNCGMWQYTNKGTVDGIDGCVDLDYTERDYPDIIKSRGLNGYGKNDNMIPVPISNTLIESGTVSETATQILIVLNKKV